MAQYKKKARRLGAYIVFVDESGFLLIPSVRKTWAPKGITPILTHRYKRDKVSVISGITISPLWKRLGLYFRIHTKNIQQAEVVEFLSHLLRHLKGHVIVIWDNGRPHKGEPIREICRRWKRLHLYAIPSYAPELDPDEGVWTQAKGKLANGCPDDLDELIEEVMATLRSIKGSQKKLRGCLQQSALQFF